MNRRSFLRLLMASGAAATVDRKYFFAPTGGWSPRQPFAATEWATDPPEFFTELQLRLRKPKNAVEVFMLDQEVIRARALHFAAMKMARGENPTGLFDLAEHCTGWTIERVHKLNQSAKRGI